MDISISIGVLIVGIVTAIVNVYGIAQNRGKREAETHNLVASTDKLSAEEEQTLVQTALAIARDARDEAEKAWAEVRKMREELLAVHGVVDVLQLENTRLKQENTHLKAANNKLGREALDLRQRVNELEDWKRRMDTGDLKTPPPHTLPNWQEPPPPESDNPADWE